MVHLPKVNHGFYVIDKHKYSNGVYKYASFTYFSDFQIPSTNDYSNGLYAFDDMERNIFLSCINCIAT